MDLKLGEDTRGSTPVFGSTAAMGSRGGEKSYTDGTLHGVVKALSNHEETRLKDQHRRAVNVVFGN